MTLDIHLVGGGTDWTAIAGIAGTLSAGLLGGWFSDRRRFTADRKLRSADDLVTQIDDVAVALEALADVAATMRSQVVTYGLDREKLGPSAQATQVAYQTARAAIARLAMRPHAGTELVDKATTASKDYLAAYMVVHMALTSTSSDAERMLGNVLEHVEKGYESQRTFESAARDAIEKLLGAPAR